MNRPIYTARVTQIEALRKFLWGQTEDNQAWINEGNVTSTIKGISGVNVKADFGTAGHSIIEDALRYKTNTGYQVKKFTFTDKQAEPLLKHAAEHPFWVREVPLSKLYHTTDFDLIVTGTTDAIEGVQLRDTKFKFSSFDLDEYYASAQWRIYLHMIGLNTFHYDFFRVKGFECMDDCNKAVIANCESLAMYRYPEMEQDIQEIIQEFADFVTFKDLTGYMEITLEKYAKIIRGDSSLRTYIKAKGLV